MDFDAEYYYSDGEQLNGPTSLGELVSMVRIGEIHRSIQVTPGGHDDWQSLESVIDIPELYSSNDPYLELDSNIYLYKDGDDCVGPFTA